MPYKPMMTNYFKAKRKSVLQKQLELPIVFPYPNETDFFETLLGWAEHHDFVLSESDDHYMGFASPRLMRTGLALLASWNEGQVSFFIFSCDKFDQMVKGENKHYLVDAKGIKNTFKTLFELFNIPL